MQVDILNQGLRLEFAEKSNPITVIENGKSFTIYKIELENGITYIDKYLTNGGGGVELIFSANGNGLIRQYCGNSALKSLLDSLNITEKDIMQFLASIILNLNLNTRLNNNVNFKNQNWEYDYNVTSVIENPFLIIALEKIYYNGKLVFAHTINISQISEL